MAKPRQSRQASGREADPFEVRAGEFGKGIFARRLIARGARLFGPDDYADEVERAAFIRLTAREFAALPRADYEAFIRYAYNVAPDVISGTFDWSAAHHPSNFINHSCDPNAGYDSSPEDNIVALRDIRPGEQICMDYGTCTFSFDHEFACQCGSEACRGRIRRDDWKMLVRAGTPILSFMEPLVRRLLSPSADRVSDTGPAQTVQSYRIRP